MAKKIIRLNEAELRQKVKNIITELDWKTYMNASKKAYDEDDYDRSNDFLDAAEQSYKDKYNAQTYKGYGSYDLGSGDGHNPYKELRTNTDGDYIGDGDDEDYVYQRTATQFNNDGYGPDVDSQIGDVYDSDVFDVSRDNKMASSMSADDYEDGSPEWNDVRDYVHGKSKYVKGKGWTSESKKRKTIRLTESELKNLIKHIIKEDYGFDDESYFSENNNINEKYQEIESGQYDRQIERLYQKGFDSADIIYAIFGEYDPDTDEPLNELIDDKLSISHKDYAMKMANRYKDGYNKYPHNADDAFTDQKYNNKYQKEKDLNTFMKEKEASEYPDLLKKNGDVRSTKQIIKHLSNRKNLSGAKMASEKEPLHRKGSLNREL